MKIHDSIKIAIFFAGLIFSHFSWSQNEMNLMETPENWRKEIIPFPLSFAPSLEYKGLEEVRFLDGWPKKDSDEFWTYTFLWHLDDDPKITVGKLAVDIEAYFDGLMQIIAKGDNIAKEDVPKTVALFYQESQTSLIGKVKFYDAFFNKGITTLNIKVDMGVCAANDKFQVLFKLSPKEMDNKIWDRLNQVKPICEK